MIVPIFPLPNVVFFPKTLLPLHIFEQRYRAMTREALAGDSKITIALLRTGWESRYQGNPAVHEIACMGKITTHEELEGGKYNIVLEGEHRVRLVRELKHSPYRLAEVEMMEEQGCDDRQKEVIIRRNQLGGMFIRFAELATRGAYKSVELVSQLSFETLVNMVASTINMPVEDKQALLEMDDLTHRCDVLVPILRRQLEALVLIRDFDHLKPEDPGRN